jgi:hypothetical protein
MPSIVIGGWNCICTIEESAGNRVDVEVRLAPCPDATKLVGSYRSDVETKLELGDGRLKAAASLTALCGSVAGGRLSAFASFDGVSRDDVRAIVLSFAGETKRIEVS